MDFVDCYRLLGLRAGASAEEIKASYRRLARKYHPDFNPGDKKAQAKFVEVTEAYKYLLSQLEAAEKTQAAKKPPEAGTAKKPTENGVKQEPPVAKVKRKQTTQTTKDTRKPPPVQENIPLSANDFQLKWTCYHQLQKLLKSRRFARAIALVEGLAQRLPNDLEVRQWQAISYQRWAHQLINEKQLDKARVYLKKALKTDPHNRSLWAEIEREFRRMEQIFR